MMPKLKICGVNDAGFAVEAARRGVDYIGLIFVAKSPRCVALGDAKAIRAAAVRAVADGKKPRFAGVFTDASRHEIARIADEVPLDVVQLHSVAFLGEVLGGTCRCAACSTAIDSSSVLLTITNIHHRAIGSRCVIVGGIHIEGVEGLQVIKHK